METRKLKFKSLISLCINNYFIGFNFTLTSPFYNMYSRFFVLLLLRTYPYRVGTDRDSFKCIRIRITEEQ